MGGEEGGGEEGRWRGNGGYVPMRWSPLGRRLDAALLGGVVVKGAVWCVVWWVRGLVGGRVGSWWSAGWEAVESRKASAKERRIGELCIVCGLFGVEGGCGGDGGNGVGAWVKFDILIR